MQVVVVGGVAGGMAVATRMRRLRPDADVTVIEQGQEAAFANCALPFYLGGRLPAGRQALRAASPELLRRRYGLNLLTGHRCVSVDRKGHQVRVQGPDGCFILPYDALVLSPGARAVIPPFAQGTEHVYTLRTPQDAEALESEINAHPAGRVVVAGGGFIGIEAAENLRERGLEVTLIEGGPQIMPSFDRDTASVLEAELRGHGITLYTGCLLSGITRHTEALEVQAGQHRIAADFVVLALGIRPCSELAADCGLELIRGYIRVDDRMRTSDPDIYALGDATVSSRYLDHEMVNQPLAGPLSRQARVICWNITGEDRRYPGFLGTAAVQIFSVSAARCGMNAREARRAGFADAADSWTHTVAPAGFMPGAQEVHCRLTFELTGGRLLGAEAAGTAEAVRMVEAVASMMYLKGTVSDLAAREQAYVPPLSAVRDTAGMAGSVALNLQEGLCRAAAWYELDSRFAAAFRLDVRTPAEYAAGHMPGFVNIPLDDLEGQLEMLPHDRAILITCRSGMRGYLACRLLFAHGFSEVYNLSGGMLTMEAAGLAAVRDDGQVV